MPAVVVFIVCIKVYVRFVRQHVAFWQSASAPPRSRSVTYACTSCNVRRTHLICSPLVLNFVVILIAPRCLYAPLHALWPYKRVWGQFPLLREYYYIIYHKLFWLSFLNGARRRPHGRLPTATRIPGTKCSWNDATLLSTALITNCTYNLNRTERAFIIIVVTVTDAFARR